MYFKKAGISVLFMQKNIRIVILMPSYYQDTTPVKPLK